MYYDTSGLLVEDLTDDYLETSESTISPVPLAVSDILDANQLSSIVRSQHLTHVFVSGIEDLFCRGLKWGTQYDSLAVFVAPPSAGSGPGLQIRSLHSTAHRTYTLGMERFVTGAALYELPLSVSSDVPLAEIGLYNGRILFRRFTFPAETPTTMFQRLLMLDGFIHRNLNIVIRDVNGGQTLASTRRNWKPGSARSVIFCGDHFNACDSNGVLLAHGVFRPSSAMVTVLPPDIAGETWDGGPPARLPLLLLQDTYPCITTASGYEAADRFTQTPRLEYSDEGGVAVASFQNRRIDDRVEKVTNEWGTFGPIAGPSELFNATIRYREYFASTLGVPRLQYPGFSLWQGTIATLFRSEITFKTHTIVTDLQLMKTADIPAVTDITLVIAATEAAEPQVFNASVGNTKNLHPTLIASGGWFAAFSPSSSANAHIWYNRGAAVMITARPAAFDWASISAVLPPQGMQVRPGDSLIAELAQIGLATTQPVHSVKNVQALVSYLQHPSGLKISRGKRASGTSGGLLDVMADASSVALRVAAHEHTDMMLPLRVGGLQSRWSVGLWQIEGYAAGCYSNGSGVYSALGLDDHQHAHVPLYVGKGPANVVVGHPVIAAPRVGLVPGLVEQMFIQVTLINSSARIWHVDVNNPTNCTIEAELVVSMPEAAGLVVAGDVATVSVSVGPGQMLNVM